jgi:hypothetical protein
MRVILHDRACECPSSELARSALTRARVEFERRPLDTRVPVLVLGDTLVRGYTDELYERAQASLSARSGS